MTFTELDVRPVRLAASLAVLIGAMACADRPTEPVANPNAPRGPSSSARLDCVASVLAKTVACSPAKTGANADVIILGGQGTYIQLTASNVAYNATASTFVADFSVQNLTAQQLGTTTGLDTTGVDVFLSSGPTGLGGTVTFTGDGSRTFIASSQPYVHYGEILDAFGGTSHPRTWTFGVPASVSSFTFTVLISSTVPDNSSVLRWNVERGFATYSNQLIYGIDARNVFAFGSREDDARDGEVYTVDRFDGAAWHTVSSDFGVHVLAAWASSPSDIWAVGGFGPSGGNAAHFDGSSWTFSTAGIGGDLISIWGSGPADVYAITSGGSIIHYDGASWSPGVDISGTFVAVSGTGPDNVLAIGHDANGFAIVARFHSGVWTFDTLPTEASAISFDAIFAAGSEAWAVGNGGSMHYANGTWQFTSQTALLTSVHGSDGTNVWAVGYSQTVQHDMLVRTSAALRWDPTTQRWNPTPTGGAAYFTSVWTSGPTNVWALGFNLDATIFETDGVPFHWDGTSWTAVGSRFLGIQTADLIQSINGVFGADASNVWAVGTSGQILRNTGSGWHQVPQTGGPETTINWNGVWGTGANDIWIVGDSGRVRHWDGSALASVPTPTSIAAENLKAVFGFATNNVYAVGDLGSVIHYDGSAWSGPVASLETRLNAIWGKSPTSIWAVGENGAVFHWDGTSWTFDSSSPCCSELYAIAPGADSIPVVVGQYGAIFRDNDGWLSETSNTDAHLFGMFSDGAGGHLYAVGGRGTILRYVVSTSSWVPLASGISSDIHSIWMSSPTNIFTGGVGEFIAHGSH